MKIGDIIQVTFLDHSSQTGIDGAAPIEIECIGRLLKKTPQYYVLGSWLPTDNSYMNNAECFSVLISTVVRVKRLK